MVLWYGLAEKVEAAGQAPSQARSPGPLTRREQQIAELVAQGFTNKKIAATLAISQRTVDAHVEHIMVKLGFTSRAQIAAWITENLTKPRT
ncbi:response regulator transcription factor [Saccharopolyspora shandongensis]|uniref:response regulator transcription factor n=1 Tax=Saccharopolyspora shandongensis TaxID=418495 RepID=UPI00340DC3B5